MSYQLHYAWDKAYYIIAAIILTCTYRGTILSNIDLIAGSTAIGPRFDKEGTFLAHSVLGPTHDYANELRNTGRVRADTNIVSMHVHVHIAPFMRNT